jgi:hypothetical protein
MQPRSGYDTQRRVAATAATLGIRLYIGPTPTGLCPSANLVSERRPGPVHPPRRYGSYPLLNQKLSQPHRGCRFSEPDSQGSREARQSRALLRNRFAVKTPVFLNQRFLNLFRTFVTRHFPCLLDFT